jgi:hypothetical protein
LNRNCLPFQRTAIHLRILVGFVLLNLKMFLYIVFFRYMLICFAFSSAIVLSVLGFMVSDYLFDIFKLFFQNLFTYTCIQNAKAVVMNLMVVNTTSVMLSLRSNVNKMFCRSLFVLLSFFMPSCCLFFFDLRILITP